MSTARMSAGLRASIGLQGDLVARGDVDAGDQVLGIERDRELVAVVGRVELLARLTDVLGDGDELQRVSRS